jgi:hypothetical protein
MRLQIQVLNASTSREIEAAFASFVAERPDALFVGISPFFIERRVQLAQLAARHAVPAIYQDRLCVMYRADNGIWMGIAGAEDSEIKNNLIKRSAISGKRCRCTKHRQRSDTY